jgi:hypothetical protein
MLGKKPLDFIMRQFHEAMELLLEYDRDQTFVPSPDQLVLLEQLHSKLRLFGPTSYILLHKMRDRAKGIC